VVTQATAATQASQSPGLFLLAWGLFASAFGLLLATNFRGFTDNFARKAEASSAGLRKLQLRKPQRSPAEQVKLARLLAIPFAIIGPVVTVAGFISISHAGIGGSGPGALPDPFRYVVIALAAAAVGWSWLSRRGLFRPAIRRGGWRLAVAVLSSLGGLIFGVGIATGQLAIAIAAWAIGGLTSLILVLDDKPPGPGPADVRDNDPV
jgi:lysylphosphatidylglycerol synthetase-like protein (DUF2156 family)